MGRAGDMDRLKWRPNDHGLESGGPTTKNRDKWNGKAGSRIWDKVWGEVIVRVGIGEEGIGRFKGRKWRPNERVEGKWRPNDGLGVGLVGIWWLGLERTD